MKKRRTQQKPKVRNFVAKNAFNKTGAGKHVDKKGEKAPRVRQKRAWKRDLIKDLD